MSPRLALALIAGAALGLAPVARAAAQGADQTMPRPAWRERPPAPRIYVAPRRGAPLALDGRLDDEAWAGAPWSEPFTDIEGDLRPAPRHATRVRMLWDDTHWYIAAELEEPDLWATLRERDAVIYHDNDFELFADPDDDTHRYFELEINALGTVWDLFLTKPYRDGGQAVNAWDIAGLAAAVALDGTLNDARDRDRGWTVELAIPWAAFSDSGRTRAPPHAGDTWRVNFSRVQWDLDADSVAYRKRLDAATGKPLPEHNWVWSPQGAVNMHMPELWGRVRFAGPDGGGGARADEEAAARDEAARDEERRWALRRVYYGQRAYRRANRAWATSLSALGIGALPPGLTMRAAGDGWEASLPSPGGGAAWHIRADGLTWRTPAPEAKDGT